LTPRKKRLVGTTSNDYTGLLKMTTMLFSKDKKGDVGYARDIILNLIEISPSITITKHSKSGVYYVTFVTPDFLVGTAIQNYLDQRLNTLNNPEEVG